MYTFVVATAGEEGRKCLMREIELGKLIGENVSPNIVKFMGCVTTQSKYEAYGIFSRYMLLTILQMLNEPSKDLLTWAP